MTDAVEALREAYDRWWCDESGESIEVLEAVGAFLASQAATPAPGELTEEELGNLRMAEGSARIGASIGPNLARDLATIRRLARLRSPARPAASEEMVEKVAIRDIAAERQRQVDVEGWTPEHDDTHSGGEIANAAADYAATGQHPVPWSWAATSKASKPRRRQLVVAGALIVAEIERLDRAAMTGGE